MVSRRQFPGLATLLVGLLLPWCLSAPVLAQTGLMEQNAAEPTVPTPGELTPGWWAYMEDADDALPRRAEALKAALDEAVLSLTVADSPEAVTRADRAKREIDEYVQARATVPPASALTLKNSGPFTLGEYLAARDRSRALQRDIERATVEAAELRDLRSLERRNVDELFGRYLKLSDPVERVRTGLAVIADRALLAVSNLKLERKQAQIQTLQDHRTAYQRQAEEARRQLTTEGFDLAEASQRLKTLQTELAAAREGTGSAKGALLDLDPAKDEDGIRGGYVRQRLLAAHLNENSVALKLARTRATIAWYQLSQSEDGVFQDQAEALLEELRPVAERVRSERASWQRSAEQFLLIGDGVTTIRDRELRLLRERSRELSRENLRSLGELDRLYAELLDVRQVLEASIAAGQSGVSGMWRRAALAGGELWSRLMNVADMALFHFGDVPVTPAALVKMTLTLVLAWLISLAIRRGLDRLGQRRHFSDRSSLYLLGRVAHYVIITTAVFVALTHLGFNFTSVALVAGALSVGIGFGLQSIVNNFVSGLILMFDRSLKIGDYIELDSGLTGIVKEIKVRSTRINTNDNVDVLVPNAEFFSTRLINWTHADNMARFRIPFGVAYGSDKDLVRESVLKAAEDVEYTLHNMPGKEPEVWMTGFGDSSLDFVLLVWVSRQGVRRPSRVRSAYIWAIDNRLREAGVEIPFPQRDLHLRSGFTGSGVLPE